MANIMAEINNNQEIKSDDLPQEITESYGTGVKDLPGYNVGEGWLQQTDPEYTQISPELAGGDVDGYWQDADAIGDEALGGSTPTPDQNVTEEVEAAVGLEMNDNEPLHTNDILEHRDDARWELDPMSADDYKERT